MTWFRWKKRREEAPAEAAVPEALEREEPARRNTAEPELAGAPAPRKPRRARSEKEGRDGSRRGRAAGCAPGAEPTVDAQAGGAQGSQAGAAEARGQAIAGPQASATARATFPDVTKEILVSVEVLEQTVAVVEDGQVAEVYLERPSHRSIAGNIYKGVVDNVLPGMEASFVDVGLDRNGFLYVDEIVVPELEGKRHGKRIQELISRGQEVLVQAVKDPMGTKEPG